MSRTQLTVADLHKSYGDVKALDGCSFTVDRGQMLGFLGPNGSGKTTTMRAIVGLVLPDSGSLSWGSEPLTAAHRSRIGYMPQERGLYVRMKVREHIAYIGRLAGLEAPEAERRANVWIERVGLDTRADDPIQELSVGNQQRVQLAVALVHEP
ncbi:MAG: ABC-2 type transport system ATP-binding protein [Candidatus Poriferisodalaceae bacterium]|jgi:ABC-2 type transport system ATP-binding protein